MAEPTDIAEEIEADAPRPLARITAVLAVAAAVTVLAAAVPILVGAERLISAVGGWLTGYEVEVKGSADLRFWGTPGVDADDVIVRLPGNRFVPVDSPPVARIARLEVDLDLWALARGVLHARRLVLVRPSLRFDRGPDGVNNWNLRGKPRLDGEASTPGRPVLSTPVWPWGEIGALKIDSGSLRYTDARLDRDMTLDGVSVEASTSKTAEGSVMRLRGDARLRGEPVYLEGELRRLEDFRDGIRVPFNLMLDAAPGSLMARGTLAHRGRWAFGADLDLDIDDPKALAAIWPAMSADLLGRVSARMRAELKGGRAELSVRNLVLGKTDLSGRLSLDTDEKLPAIDMELEAGALDLRHVAAAARIAGLVENGVGGVKVKSYAIGGRGRIKWARLIAPGLDLGGGSLGLSWRTGEPNMAAEVGSLPLFGGTVSARAEATVNEGKTALSLTVSGSDLDAALMTAALLGGHGVAGRLHGNFEALTVGATGAEMLAAVSGSGRMTLSEGRIFGSVLQQAVDKEQRSVGLSRASMNFAVEGGVLTGDQLLLDFDVGHVRAGLTWDMGAGQLTVKFKSAPLFEGKEEPPVVSGPVWDVLLAR